MLTKLFVALLIIAGLFLIFEINPFAPLGRLRAIKFKMPQKKQTAAAFVRELEGKKRENLVQRSLNDTKNSLAIIGQREKYRRTVKFSVFTGAAGAAAALLLFSSPLLMIVLGTGCGLIPLWFTNLSVYDYSRAVNDELETALSMITTAYSHHKDIVGAITETLPHVGNVVKPVFNRFFNTVSYIDSNIESAIIEMKKGLDNTVFHEWCDILTLCQNDHTLVNGLQPIVDKISRLKAQQEKNETQMMLPLQNILTMVCIVCSCVPLLMVINPDWYQYLTKTLVGQVVMSVVSVIIFASIHKAIRLSKPIEYRI